MKKKTSTPIAQALVNPQPKVIRNRIVLALDTSGSMGHLRDDVMRAANAMLRTVREKTEQEGQRTDVAIVMFDSAARVHFYPADVRSVGELRYYPIQGMTALFDGVGLAAETVDDHDQETSYLVLTFTDGGENDSRRFDREGVAIRRFVAERQGRGNWSFAFQVPKNQRELVARQFGVPLDNVREWEQTERGVEEVRDTTQAGLASYFNARSKGVRSVSEFYVQTDLSGLKSKDLKKELDDISARFKVLTVDKESSVKEFVEAKTGRPYVIGSAYYCLTKPEKVQPRKAVLIMEKGKPSVWGGDEARDLIGLPTDGKAHAKVEPGNHSNYDVYVQSTSVNRKLVRGTKVLVDMTQSRGLAPTWDHTKVKAKV